MAQNEHCFRCAFECLFLLTRKRTKATTIRKTINIIISSPLARPSITIIIIWSPSEHGYAGQSSILPLFVWRDTTKHKRYVLSRGVLHSLQRVSKQLQAQLCSGLDRRDGCQSFLDREFIDFEYRCLEKVCEFSTPKKL